MPFGYAPYTRDPLDQLVDQRLRNRLAPGGEEDHSVLELNPLDARSVSPDVLSEPAPTPEKKSYLSGLLSRVGSPEGLAALGAGLAASQARGRQGGLERLGLGLAGTAGSLEASRKTKVAEDIAKGKAEKTPRQTRQEQLQGEIDALKALGLSDEEIKARYRAKENPEDTAGKLKAQEDFLRSIGYNDEEIKKHFEHGTSGTGRVTDTELLAQSMVAQGRAKNLDEGRILAHTIGQQPRVAGSITRVIADPKDPFSSTTRRLNVFQRINQQTGNYELLDENGDLVGPEDLQTFRNDPIKFQGGTGGPATINQAPQPPQIEQAPQPMEMVPSHAPTPGLAPQGSPAQPSGDESKIIGLLSGPGVRPEVLMLYASGKGPLGDSPQIRAIATQRLQGH